MGDPTDDGFAESAVRGKLLTREQIEECRRVQQESAAAGETQSLAAVVLARGLLSQAQVEAVKRAAAPAGPRKFGPYEIVRKLGQGRLGTTFLARDPERQRLVALKVLPRMLTSNKTFLERCVAQAKDAARVKHPGLARLYRFAKAGDNYYLASEYIEGESLAARLAREGKLDESRAVEIIATVAEALHQAHSQGVVHGDITPARILIDPSGRARLIGLAFVKQAPDVGPAQQYISAPLDLPRYMAPEACGGARRTDARSDIYSLGATLFHALTGFPPFEGETPFEVVKNLVETPTPNPKKLNSALSYQVSAAVHTMMGKNPKLRPESCRAVVELLRRPAAQVAAPLRRAPFAPEQAAPPSAISTYILPGALWVGVLIVGALFFSLRGRATRAVGVDADPRPPTVEDRRPSTPTPEELAARGFARDGDLFILVTTIDPGFRHMRRCLDAWVETWNLSKADALVTPKDFELGIGADQRAPALAKLHACHFHFGTLEPGASKSGFVSFLLPEGPLAAAREWPVFFRKSLRLKATLPARGGAQAGPGPAAEEGGQ